MSDAVLTGVRQTKDREPDRFDRKLKESYDYVWKERDDFIRWVAFFAVSAMYFAISLLLDNRKAEQPYFAPLHVSCLEASVLCFFTSVALAVIYKWRWSVKYLFDELELEFLKQDWQDEESGQVRKPGRLFIDTPAYENMKKSIKAQVRLAERIYKAAMSCFVLAFIPLLFALALFLHPLAGR